MTDPSARRARGLDWPGDDRPPLPRELVFVGVNYAPRRMTGDKNFWLALMPHLASHVDRITVLSIKDTGMKRELLRIDEREVEVVYVRPAFSSLRRWSTYGPSASIGKRVRRSRVLAQIARLLAIRRLAVSLDDLLDERPASHVHLMDNFGAANRLLARVALAHGTGVSVSAIAYDRRGRWAYDRFLMASYRVPGMKVVAYSRAFERRLSELGVTQSSLVRIPWGVDPVSAPTDADKVGARTRLGLPAEGRVVLWAGFIQQVRELEFWSALRIANGALDHGIDCTFLFAFKPESFHRRFASRNRPACGVHVRTTDVAQFRDALVAADVLLSPINERGCIVPPPLTWIEAMALGVPILTTPVPGADEMVVDGVTGRIASTSDAIIPALRDLVREPGSMIEACQAQVASHYNLGAIARAYLALWFGGSS